MKTENIRGVWYKTNIIVPLRGFCKVYECGSFSSAAKELGVSQSTMTRQVQAIEREIKSPLFKKAQNGGIEPTENARFFYGIVKPKVQSIDCIYDYFFSKDSDNHDNSIRVSGHHTFISNIMPECINRYKNGNNGYTMTNFFIKNSNFYDALNDLDNGSIDVAIYPIENFPDDRKHNESKYIHEELLTLRPAIILNKNNSLAKKNGSEITFEDLRKQNMLLVDKDKILSVYAEICEAQNISGNILFENSDWETIRNFLKLNLGVQFYSNIHRISNFIDNDLVIKDIFHLFPDIRVDIIIKKGKILKSSLSKFIKVIKDVSIEFSRNFSYSQSENKKNNVNSE